MQQNSRHDEIGYPVKVETYSKRDEEGARPAAILGREPGPIDQEDDNR
jgi:hypothetical protein